MALWWRCVLPVPPLVAALLAQHFIRDDHRSNLRQNAFFVLNEPTRRNINYLPRPKDQITFNGSYTLLHSEHMWCSKIKTSLENGHDVIIVNRFEREKKMGWCKVCIKVFVTFMYTTVFLSYIHLMTYGIRSSLCTD